MYVGFPLLVIALIVGALLWARRAEGWRRARLLKRTGFAITALVTAFFGAFVVGETISDPGGWQAVGLIALYLIPLLVAGALAWFRPGWASWALGLLVAAVIGMSVWLAIDPVGWRRFEDRNGPVRGIVVWVLAAAIGLLGLKRTAAAGWMLVVLGVMPVAISSLGSHVGWVSLSVVTSPTLIVGLLYVASTAVAARSTPPGTERSGPQEMPKAA